MRHYRIGETIPLSNRFAIEGDLLERPVWHALQVMSGQEQKATNALKARGVHCCYPTREKAWRIAGRLRKRLYAVVPGIVYAKFYRAPMWHSMKQRRIITGVFCRDNIPIDIHGDIIAHVMGLPTEAERIEQARREMMRVHPGDKARITDGPLADLVVDVETTKDGRVFWSHISGLKGEADEGKVIKAVE